MLDAVLQPLVLMKRPQGFSGPEYERVGAVIRHRATGQVRAHMIEAYRMQGPTLPGITAAASVLNLGVSVANFVYMRKQFDKLNRRLDAIDQKLDVIDCKLDVIIGAVQQIDRKVNAVGQELVALSGRFDRRYRDDVFAEIGAVMDTLAFADKKSQNEAASLVASNMMPARKALRRFSSFLDELAEGLAPSDVGQVELLNMRLLHGIALLKLDIAAGESKTAAEQACQICSETHTAASTLLTAWLETNPLRSWVGSVKDEFVLLLENMENLDGVSPMERLLNEFFEERNAKPAKHSNGLGPTASAFGVALLGPIYSEIYSRSRASPAQGNTADNVAKTERHQANYGNSVARLAALVAVARGVMFEANLMAIDSGRHAELAATLVDPFAEEFVCMPLLAESAAAPT